MKHQTFNGKDPKFSKHNLPFKLTDLNPFRYLNLDTDFSDVKFKNAARNKGTVDKHVNELLDFILNDEYDVEQYMTPFVIYNKKTKKYEIVAGFHRFKAFHKAGKKLIPVTVVEILPGHDKEESMRKLQLWENKPEPYTKLVSSDEDIISTIVRALPKNASEDTIIEWLKLSMRKVNSNRGRKLLKAIKEQLGQTIPDRIEVPNKAERDSFIASHKARYPDKEVITLKDTPVFTGGWDPPEWWDSPVADEDYEHRVLGMFSQFYEKFSSHEIQMKLIRGEPVEFEMFYAVNPEKNANASFDDITGYKSGQSDNGMLGQWIAYMKSLVTHFESGNLKLTMKPIPQTKEEQEDYDETGAFYRGITLYDLR